MIELKDWSVTWPDGTEAVKNLSFRVQAGERTALIGGNGAGKSTLIRSLVGVLPGEGYAALAGIPVEKKNYRELRRKAGVVFQNPDDQLFLPRIRDNVAFGLKNLGVSPEETDRRVQNILQQFNIPELSGRLSMKLSGGEKRLAALASVMVMEPEVLLLDEPTAFLDPKARRNLIRVLKRLPQTMLIATHDLSFAAEVCPRAVLLSRGTLIAEKATEEIDEDLIS